MFDVNLLVESNIDLHFFSPYQVHQLSIEEKKDNNQTKNQHPQFLSIYFLIIK